MKLLLSWLKDFVDVPADPQELKHRLTEVGLAVESVSESSSGPVLEAEITTNRPDCLNHYGAAREVSTAYRLPLKRLEFAVYESGPPVVESASVEIQNPERCARYCARVIRDVQVKPSPDWIVKRLEAVGARSVNNVADVTNYVLLELGQPLHAFDLDRLRGAQIKVRNARPGEPIKTLDGTERTLGAEDLVIADAQCPVALAGVMGGEGSAISAGTKSVLLESAWFDPISIRRTAKSQKMHTEASHRFERGADIEMAPLALDRATELIRELAGGSVQRGAIDIYPQPRRPEKLTLSRSALLRVLGAEIPWEDVERILRSLGFAVDRHRTAGWGVTPPSFRLDVTREVDLIEEVARHFGYDRLPARLLPAPPRASLDENREKYIAVTETLVRLGYREIVTSPMVDPAENERFGGLPSVVLENPLSQEASALRSTPIPSMLRALRWNLDRGQRDLRLFEVGKIYWTDPQGHPAERPCLALGVAGDRQPASILAPARSMSFFDLKGDLDSLFGLFDVPGLVFSPGGERVYDLQFSGRYAAGEITVATLGRLAAHLETGRAALGGMWLAEIDLERLLELPLKVKSFRSISRFPSVERDFSLIVPSEVTYARIAAAIHSLALPELFSIRPVELFQSAAIGRGKYSLLLRTVLQSADHTLSGEEIATISQKIIDALGAIGVLLRS